MRARRNIVHKSGCAKWCRASGLFREFTSSSAEQSVRTCMFRRSQNESANTPPLPSKSTQFPALTSSYSLVFLLIVFVQLYMTSNNQNHVRTIPIINLHTSQFCLGDPSRPLNKHLLSIFPLSTLRPELITKTMGDKDKDLKLGESIQKCRPYVPSHFVVSTRCRSRGCPGSRCQGSLELFKAPPLRRVISVIA
jgi:hypothetical protein